MRRERLAIQYGQNFLFVSNTVTLTGTALFTLVASLRAIEVLLGEPGTSQQVVKALGRSET